MQKLVTTVVVATAILVFSSCKTEKAASDIEGYTGDQIKALSARAGAPIAPRYEAIAANGVFRLAIFISKDNDEVTAGFNSRDYYRRPQFGLVQNGRTCNDYGCLAYDDLIHWFTSSGFLVNVQAPRNEPSPTSMARVVIEGDREFTKPKSRPVHWIISLHLGNFNDDRTATGFAEEFGRAAAHNDLTILNGHFYSQDAMRASRTLQAPQWSQISNRAGSEIYGPAMNAFAAELSRPGVARLPYRMVFFNGCLSEMIENQFLTKAQQVGIDRDVDLLTMNGYSNYRFFGPQISGLVMNLVMGADYETVLRDLKVEAKDQALMSQWASYFQNMSHHFVPAVRNRAIDDMCANSRQDPACLLKPSKG